MEYGKPDDPLISVSGSSDDDIGFWVFLQINVSLANNSQL